MESCYVGQAGLELLGSRVFLPRFLGRWEPQVRRAAPGHFTDFSHGLISNYSLYKKISITYHLALHPERTICGVLHIVPPPSLLQYLPTKQTLQHRVFGQKIRFLLPLPTGSFLPQGEVCSSWAAPEARQGSWGSTENRDRYGPIHALLLFFLGSIS